MIEHARANSAVRSQLAGVNCLRRPAVQLRADVVEMRDHLQAVFLEGKVAVGVEQIWLVLVDQVGHAVEIVLAPGVGNAGVAPIDLRTRELRAAGIVIEIGVLGIDAVVRDAGQRSSGVGAVAHGKPLVTDP